MISLAEPCACSAACSTRRDVGLSLMIAGCPKGRDAGIRGPKTLED